MDGGTRNELSGTVYGNVVQARSVTVVYPDPPPRHGPPDQVPAPPAGFTNRVRELAGLRALAAQPDRSVRRPVIAAVRGMPGIGKTALLRRATAELAPLYPDGTLHVSYGPSGESPSEAAARFLLGLGIPQLAVPAAFAARVDLLRQCTRDLKLIVVCDDVSEPAQVTALLPNSADSLVLVAGGQVVEELLLDGPVERVELDPLSAADGVALLAEVCRDGRVRDAPAGARALVAACGGHPLALRAAAARLVARPRLTVADLAAELAVDDQALAAPATRRVFDLAYLDLSERARRVYRTLGVLVGRHFSVEVVAAMCELTVPETRRVLDDLVAAALVEDRADGGCGLHRLVRAHALARSAEEDDEAERTAALRRAVRWWLVGAVAADVSATDWSKLRTVPPDQVLGDTRPAVPRAAALAWLAAEHDNLTGLMRACRERGWHREVWQFFEALFPYYDAVRPLASWVRAGLWAVDSAERDGDPAAEARARCLLGKAYQELGRHDDADAQLTRAHQLALRSGSRRLVGSAHDFLGNLRLRTGDPAAALDHFQRALAINEELGQRRGTALMLMMCGRALARLGRLAEALAAFDRGAALAPSDSLLPKFVLSRGRALVEADQPADAERVLREAVAVAERAGALAVRVEALELLGGLARRRGDTERARECLDQVIAAYQEMGSPRAARLLAERATTD